MPVESFTASDFRCLQKVELDADPAYNLIYGANASGKTSLLEALAYLGRGKSFRGAPAQSLVRHGATEFVLFGRVENKGARSAVGVKNNREGLEIRIDGSSGGGAAALAELLPLQVIDPEVHALVSGGPEQRRRYLDWIVFHVEHGYLEIWRRFRRALKQRNAALKRGSGPTEIHGWDAEIVQLGGRVDDARRRGLEAARPALEAQGLALLERGVRVEYQPGWPSDLTLGEALARSAERDRQLGSTQSGPHRGDIKLIVEERKARRLVSRGQQKLLASAMILAAAETVQSSLERPLLMLLDDPTAELDRDSLSRLMRQVFALDCQVVATSLERAALTFPGEAAVFHVEHGILSREQ